MEIDCHEYLIYDDTQLHIIISDLLYISDRLLYV